MNLKQLYGQTEAFLYSPRSRTARSTPTPSAPALPNVDLRIADNGEVQFKSPGMFVSYFKDDAKTTRDDDAGRLGARPATPASSTSKTGHLKIIDRAKDVGRLKDGTLFPPKYIENKLKFYPNIREAVAYGDGRDFVAVMINIDLDRGRQLGRAQQRGLRLLPGAGRPSAGLRHDRRSTSRRSTARSPRTR